jgi:hypothetical protein
VNDGMPMTYGKVTDINLHVTELKMFEGNDEKSDEAHILNSYI